MPLLPVNRLMPGMRTAQEVRDRSGRLLVGASRPLSAQNIQVFQSWGVAAVAIEGDEDYEAVAGENEITLETADPERLREATARIDALFLHVDRTHPAAAELSRVVTLRLLKQPAGVPRP